MINGNRIARFLCPTYAVRFVHRILPRLRRFTPHNDNPHPEGLNGYITCKIVLDRGCAYSYAQGYQKPLFHQPHYGFRSVGPCGGACSNGFSVEGEPFFACIRS